MTNQERPDPNELTEATIDQAVTQLGMNPDPSQFPTAIQVMIAYEWLDAQLVNGNSDGPIGVSKTPIQAWAGYYIPDSAVEVAMHIAGISGLDKKPIFPSVHRLRCPGVGEHLNYTEDSHNNPCSQDRYAGAEPCVDGTEMSLPCALALHREHMGLKTIRITKP